MSHNRELPDTPATAVRRFGNSKFRAAISSKQGEVRTEFLQPAQTLPLVFRSIKPGQSLVAWARDNRNLIDSQLSKHGAILFRNFQVGAAREFEQFIAATSAQLLAYHERSSPRSQVSGNIYTSTDYPPTQSIFLHNENSYQQSWPMRIFFFCSIAPQRGGETPIADVRKVLARISPQTRERFVRQRWMYVRNFGDGAGLPWQVVFQTEDRAAVEAHCRKNCIGFEWKDGNRLRTHAVRPVIEQHPGTGELVWFNHATFFHVTTLDPKISNLLLAEFSADELPTNTFYGDGTDIEPAVLEELRTAYREETTTFQWQQGDVLMLDNMLVAHGRAPFAGPREILVGMADPMSRSDG
jgi:alpha-ketoglutarate-dependent taurine dioxygenase